MPGPLEGIKVLDFTHWGVGPWSAALLAEMGADVLKIEPPDGDWISRQPPPYKQGITTTYFACNPNKRIVTLDPHQERDHAVIMRLATNADVIVENRRPGYMTRRGIDYDAIKAINPGIVYCSSSGYGYEGPLRDQASSDPFGSSISGFASVNGPVGGPGEGLKGGGAHIDFSTSIYIASAILAALYSRGVTGHGQWVQTSQMQAAMALSGPRAQEFYVSGKNPQPMGSGVDNIAPSRAYLGSDGKFVAVSATRPVEWINLCNALGLSQLINDPRFQNNAARVQARAELDALIEVEIAKRPAAEWVTFLQDAKVPAAPFLIHNDVRIHRQVKALKMLQWVDTPHGELRLASPPWEFSETPAFITDVHKPNQDTAALLAEMEDVLAAESRS